MADINRPEWLQELADLAEALNAPGPLRLPRSRSDALECAECARLDPGEERGWTLRLDEDDELVAFCPECDEQEFGDGR